ncbi:melatonin receptor type 1A-like [Antedon mediterranea]|uniref:melatonin receptor type 1A-like n=1 Tax=Antedon mediterranea TaxID=105859 RepID=UPI003AF9710A
MDNKTFTEDELYSKTNRLVQAIVLCFVCLSGIIGNCLVLLAIILKRKLRNTTNVFVANLAISDLVTCLNLPVTIFALTSENDQPLNECVCAMSAVITIVCAGSSVYTLACIALVRFVYVTNFKYKSLLTMKYSAIISLIAWIISTCFTVSPLLIPDLGTFGYNGKYHSCTWISPRYLYNIILGSAFYPITFLCIIFSYSSILGIVCKRTTNAVQPANAGQATRNITKRNLSVTKNLFCVFCIFVFCGLPYSLAIIIPGTERIISYTAVLFMFNCFLNPLNYALKHPEFKKAMPEVIKCKRVISSNR